MRQTIAIVVPGCFGAFDTAEALLAHGHDLADDLEVLIQQRREQSPPLAGARN